MGGQINNQNHAQEMPNALNDNNGNNNVIRINPIGISEMRGNPGNDEDSINLNNNFEYEQFN